MPKWHTCGTVAEPQSPPFLGPPFPLHAPTVPPPYGAWGEGGGPEGMRWGSECAIMAQFGVSGPLGRRWEVPSHCGISGAVI